MRRRFYELAQSGPAPIATEALARIAAIYQNESDIRGQSPEERRTIRQERSRPLVDAFEPWLRDKLALISQKTKLAEAIRYALTRWDGLSLFLDDGRAEIDNNVVERAIRPLALTRKNALFAGSDSGAAHWATIASLIETCKLTGVDPQAYLADVISCIVNGHPQNRIDELLPLGIRTDASPQKRGLRTTLTTRVATPEFESVRSASHSRSVFMAGPKGLSPAIVKSIFRSKDAASALADRHKVSVNLIYLIQQRRIHKGITEGIRKPIRKRKSRTARKGQDQSQTRIDVRQLVDRVADIVTKRVLKGLVDRLTGKP